MKVNHGVIFGGIHGNELTGIRLIRQYQNLFKLDQNLKIDFLIGNQKAVEQCTRYTDIDLNSCFGNNLLDDSDAYYYENHRAKFLFNLLVFQKKCDFLLDLHTSTANVGCTIIFFRLDLFHFIFLWSLKKCLPHIKLFYLPISEKSSHINTIVQRGFAIEIGPVSHGTLDAQVFFEMVDVLQACFNLISEFNKLEKLQSYGKAKLEIFEYYKTLQYPKHENQISGLIHPQLNSKDYQMITWNTPVFQTFLKEDILLEELLSDTDFMNLYPIFINEAAYFEKDIAAHLTIRKTINYSEFIS